MNQTLTEAQAAKRLLAAVSIKTLVEVLFICVVVSVAAVRTFHPYLRGTIDQANGSRVFGWVVDPTAENEPVDVELFIDGMFVAKTRADGERVDLVAAGMTSIPGHGFVFSIEAINLEPGTHRAQVYAIRRGLGGTLTLVPIAKQPVVFVVE